MDFVEIRDDAISDPDPIQQDKDGFFKTLKDLTSFKKKKKNGENGKVISSDGVNRALSDRTEEDEGKLSSKKRRLSFSFRNSKGKVEPWSEKNDTTVNGGVIVDRQDDDNEATVSLSTTSETVCLFKKNYFFLNLNLKTARKIYSYPLTPSNNRT